MIKYDPCSYIQEAIFERKEQLPDESWVYKFKIPTLLPIPSNDGYIINKSKLANVNPNLIQVSRTVITDSDLVILPYSESVYGDISKGDRILIAFIGGDITRIRILGR